LTQRRFSNHAHWPRLHSKRIFSHHAENGINRSSNSGHWNRAFHCDQYPANLVDTVIYLASDNSDFMTGQSISIDGGMNMH